MYLRASNRQRKHASGGCAAAHARREELKLRNVCQNIRGWALVRSDLSDDDESAEREKNANHGRSGRPTAERRECEHTLHDDATERIEQLEV